MGGAPLFNYSRATSPASTLAGGVEGFTTTPRRRTVEDDRAAQALCLAIFQAEFITPQQLNPLSGKKRDRTEGGSTLQTTK